jgi:catechol-2,3-dioxygenase
MFIGKSDHIVLACKNIKEIRSFYEQIILLIPNRQLENYVTYTLGSFTLCFKEIESLGDVGSAVVHIGINFPTRADIDKYHQLILDSSYQLQPSEIFGGPGKGPYRFYLKDPAGYNLEFESWDGCSD